MMRKVAVVVALTSAAVANVLVPGGGPSRVAALAQESHQQHSAQNRQELLEERDRLWKEAEELEQSGRLEEALAVLEKVLALEEQIFGKVHEDAAGTLEWMARLYERSEDFAAAIEARMRVLEIRSQLYPPGHAWHWKVTDARLALADAQKRSRLSAEQRKELTRAEQLDSRLGQLYGEGKYAEAIPLAQQAMQIREKVLGEAHPDYARSLNNLAMLYVHLGEYAKAEPLYRQALEITRKVLGESHPHYATSLNNLGRLYRLMGEYSKAEPLYCQAMEIFKSSRGEEHPSYATSLNNLAVLYRIMGEFAKAEPLYRQALEMRRKVRGEEHPSYTTSLNNLAALYVHRGEYTKAEPLYRQALEIRRKVLGDAHPRCATSLNNLAALYLHMGEYRKAEPLLQQAMEITKKVLGEAHPRYAISVNNLGRLYRAMGDYAKAEPLYRQAIEIFEKALGEAHPDYATSLNNLALLYDEMGEYGKAEPLYHQVLEVRRKVLGEAHPDYSASLNNLAGLYRVMGEYAEAEPLYREALAITRRNLELAASIQSQRQQITMASRLREPLDGYLALALKAGRYHESAYGQLLQWKGQALLRQRAVRVVARQQNLQPVFEQLQHTTSRLGALALRTPDPKHLDAWRRQIAELTERRERLETQLMAASAEYRQTREPVNVAELQQALPPGAALIDFLEISYEAPAGGAKESSDVSGAAHESTASRDNTTAPNGDASKLQRQLIAFVVRHDGPVRMLDLGPAAPIAAAIDRWREGYGLGQEASEAGQFLRRRLWEPIERELAAEPAQGRLADNQPGKAGQAAPLVLISPDGTLGRLPFAALPGKTPGTYLLEEYAIALVPAPAELVLAQRLGERTESESRADGFLLVGNVNYDVEPAAPSQMPQPLLLAQASTRAARGDTFRRFERLPGTAEEVQVLEGLYRQHFGDRGLTVLQERRASEEALRRLGPRYAHLHLATHGFFAPESVKSALTDRDPSSELVTQPTVAGYHPDLLSGVVLAGANRQTAPDEEDGILTASEVSGLDLSGVELVVLSACQTGLGEVAGGEGLLGLQRAFQAAGAKTVVASLWKVDDRATRVLMEEFYTNLWQKGLGPLESLRQAQLAMLNRYDAEDGRRRGPGTVKRPRPAQAPLRTSPRLWAAFVLSGHW